MNEQLFNLLISLYTKSFSSNCFLISYLKSNITPILEIITLLQKHNDLKKLFFEFIFYLETKSTVVKQKINTLTTLNTLNTITNTPTKMKIRNFLKSTKHTKSKSKQDNKFYINNYISNIYNKDSSTSKKPVIVEKSRNNKENNNLKLIQNISNSVSKYNNKMILLAKKQIKDKTQKNIFKKRSNSLVPTEILNKEETNLFDTAQIQTNILGVLNNNLPQQFNNMFSFSYNEFYDENYQYLNTEI